MEKLKDYEMWCEKNKLNALSVESLVAYNNELSAQNRVKEIEKRTKNTQRLLDYLMKYFGVDYTLELSPKTAMLFESEICKTVIDVAEYILEKEKKDRLLKFVKGEN